MSKIKKKQSLFSKIINIINKPKFVFILIWIFIIIFFIIDGLKNRLDDNFTKFGPTTEKDGSPTSFLGIKMTNWRHVITAYIIIFITTILTNYYSNVVNKLNTHIRNPGERILKFSKFWSYLILLMDPLVSVIIYIIKFFATATFQIQYILPQFVASYISSLPFTLKWLNGTTFI
jgi:hypothetical protein